MNLQALIQQGESDTLEFKQSFDKETIETVCAFANAKVERLKTYNSTLKIKPPGLVVDIEAHQMLILNV